VQGGASDDPASAGAASSGNAAWAQWGDSAPHRQWGTVAAAGQDGGVLILLPPSESKNPPPRRGAPVDVGALSFPELAATRARVLDALIRTSAEPDTLARLCAGPSVVADVERNTCLRALPARPALEVYAGVLYDALDAATLSTAAKRRAASSWTAGRPATWRWGCPPGSRSAPWPCGCSGTTPAGAPS